ncbi:PstS family phosphate ABC transporter substrate-binding protein [Paenibacillus antarcticus]|uniref:Phosphate-binding protein n=1 Tax=Paenibacillus antarcticus TaxID=253703 RepID=A0A168JW74_9BACL|nr:substrate-binding domain-containing protein [Paenibacillus antarcticus]OAB41191.1 phosphate-binding protein [Paenibacillus antarcticus]
MGYIFRILLLHCGVNPFVFSIMTLVLMDGKLNLTILVVVTMLVSGIATGVLAAWDRHLPQRFGKRYWPVVFPLSYTVMLWAICMLVSGGFYGSSAWSVYSFLQIPFLPISFMASFQGVGILYAIAPISYYSAFLIGFFIKERTRQPLIVIQRKQLILVSIVVILTFSIGSFVQWQRSQTVLPSYGFKYGGGYSSTDLWPYDVINPSNRLPRIAEQVTFNIEDPKDMLVLDGAEAAFPVYSAFAQATYPKEGLMDDAKGEFVSFTNTINAYERLLKGEVDIYFGAEPSVNQLQMAQASGHELVMTPIGKEAFVFFVNNNNPIKGLTVQEIKDIYSGKTRFWKEIGGRNKKIIAFQRPSNSGSQTLLEKIMADTPIIKPLKEEVPRGMGGILEQVADYRNYEDSIGFSFRFFATGMNQSKGIKLLAINDVEPNAVNISDGSYPFTAKLYAITLKMEKPKPMITPFLEWMQGPQGQQLVEKVGYVRLQSP